MRLGFALIHAPEIGDIGDEQPDAGGGGGNFLKGHGGILLLNTIALMAS
jgi:hypothetical protein